jgi:hypothetical protein
LVYSIVLAFFARLTIVRCGELEITLDLSIFFASATASLDSFNQNSSPNIDTKPTQLDNAATSTLRKITNGSSTAAFQVCFATKNVLTGNRESPSRRS